MADEQGLEFQVTTDVELPLVFHSDPGRVSQILNNLLGNALKFTSRGSVVLRVYRPEPGELAGRPKSAPDSWLAFSITDTGIGMTAEKMARVFEAFNQGDGSIGRQFGGSGLGLSISRRLADLLGGRIHVASDVNEGSTFTLYLPLEFSPIVPSNGPIPTTEGIADNWFKTSRTTPEMSLEAPVSRTGDSTGMVTPAAGDRSRSASLQGQQILLCDQDMRTVFNLTSSLEDLGATVKLARSWEDALIGVRDNPDMVLVDPDAFALTAAEAGNQLLENSTREGLQVISLVSREENDQRHAWPLSLVKPVDMDQLMKIVAETPQNETVGSGV